MTNYEYYQEDIEKFARLGIEIAVEKDTNKVVACTEFSCEACLFYRGICEDRKSQWADEEHEEPDWAHIPVDTKIYVKDYADEDWFPRHFAKYDNGKVYTWLDGKSSFTSLDGEIMYWHDAKLAEEK